MMDRAEKHKNQRHFSDLICALVRLRYWLRTWQDQWLENAMERHTDKSHRNAARVPTAIQKDLIAQRVSNINSRANHGWMEYRI